MLGWVNSFTYQSLDKSSPLLSHFDQITVNVEYAVFLGQLDVGINGQVDSRTTGSITITKKYKTMTMTRMRAHFINSTPKGTFGQMKNLSYENCFLWESRKIYSFGREHIKKGAHGSVALKKGALKIGGLFKS